MILSTQRHLPGFEDPLSPDLIPVQVVCYQESGGRFSCDLFALDGGGLVARAYGKLKTKPSGMPSARLKDPLHLPPQPPHLLMLLQQHREQEDLQR